MKADWWNTDELTEVPKSCPKCGRITKAAFGESSWAHGPSYQSKEDRLLYSCRECRYSFTLPTAEKRRQSA